MMQRSFNHSSQSNLRKYANSTCQTRSRKKTRAIFLFFIFCFFCVLFWVMHSCGGKIRHRLLHSDTIHLFNFFKQKYIFRKIHSFLKIGKNSKRQKGKEGEEGAFGIP